MAHQRLDQYLLDHFNISSLGIAQSMVISGKVFVNDQKITKSGHPIKTKDLVEVRDKTNPYVSRGGLKFKGAVKAFQLDIKNKIALDVGISTGGFSDFLLKNDASFVIGIDVAYGILDYSLRNNKKLCLLERTNAKSISKSQIKAQLIKSGHSDAFADQLNLVVMDVAFISVTSILPNIRSLVTPETDFIILIKPQFEAPKDLVEKGGVITNPDTIQLVLDQIQKNLSTYFEIKGLCPSPIKGQKGNQEYFLWLTNKTIK